MTSRLSSAPFSSSLTSGRRCSVALLMLFFFPKFLMPISFWRNSTATAWPPLKAARAAASTVAFTSSALSTE